MLHQFFTREDKVMQLNVLVFRGGHCIVFSTTQWYSSQIHLCWTIFLTIHCTNIVEKYAGYREIVQV